MKPFLAIPLITVALLSSAHAIGKDKGRINGMLIENSHEVCESVLRGSQPLKHIDDLPKAGVTDVLIFKNEVNTEVRREIGALKARGYTDWDIHHIPFQWKDIEDFEVACNQAVDGLNLLLDVAASTDRKIFFHCTMGEDRTGMLAGLFRIAHDGWSMNKAFYQEMCARGYSDGDKAKDRTVVREIEKNLTPLYRSMARRIKNLGPITGPIPASICAGISPRRSQMRCN